MMKVEEMQKLAWDVWEVYKSWGQWVYLRYRPYKAHVTLANLGILVVTLIALAFGFIYLLKMRSKKKKARTLFAFEDDEDEENVKRSTERMKARLDEKIKRKLEEKEKQNTNKVGQEPANCPFKHLFGGMMEQNDGESETTSTADDKQTMAMLRDQIHKNINHTKGDGKKDEMQDLLTDGSSDDDDGDEDESDNDAEELSYLTKDGRDPLELAMHIPGELKKIQNKITTREMEKRLTDDQRKEEALARRRQLEQIFKLMQDQKEKFGEQNTDDIEEQMRMYSL